MDENSIFNIILLIARPGAGKSEIIDYLKKIPLETRINRYHVGRFKEIDDFPMLWTWLEEDEILEKMGYPRLHSDSNGYFLEQHFWDLLIERIGLEYQKNIRDIPNYAQSYTTIIEFSRGNEHGGYQTAFSHLFPEMLNKMATLYIDVSWEESLRKNRKRFNPNKPDSILEHALPDSKLERLYKEIDWYEVSKKDPRYLSIQDTLVPYVVFDNSDDVTTKKGDVLGDRLEKSLNQLWKIYKNNQ